MKQLIIFITGLGIGSIGTWFSVKKYYEKYANEEIESVKEYYKSDFIEDVRKQMTSNQEDTQTNDDAEPNYQEMINKLNYGQFSQKEPTPEVKKEEISVPGIKAPYTITPDQFVDDVINDKITLTYFSEDGVFMNEEEDTLPHGTELVGEENLDKFGEYEENVLYVRNESANTDYEVIREDRAYANSEYVEEY